jgi:hypothetical protein
VRDLTLKPKGQNMRVLMRIVAAAALVAGLAWDGSAVAGHGGGGFHGGGFHGGFRPGFFRGNVFVGDYPWWSGCPAPYSYYACPAYTDWYYYNFGVYPDPAYLPQPGVPGVAYGPHNPIPPNGVPVNVSHYCATPAGVCAKHRLGPVNAPCHCRIAGGFAEGRFAPE